ncbi:MAG TPA: sigma-70 family RNA polymerase sigma factor [Thermoleophilaceae bacterium]
MLLQEAAAGGGASYAALYDRYAEQVYNYCLRLTGSPEDAADATQDAFVNVLGRLHKDDSPVLDFSSYLFAAARNESYALMRRRSRTQLTDEPPERPVFESPVETDPERAVLLRDSQESVRQANEQLAPRHREVLALREVGGRSYEEIGQIMGISENAAAQLIWRARSKLRGALTAGAVASVVATSEECEAAQVLINRLQDGEPVTDAEHEWLEDHLDECQRCRAARGMIFEVATSYRLWAPVALLATMKADVLAAAGGVVGADWTSASLSAGGAGGTGGAGGAGGAHASGAGHAGRFAKRPRGAQAAAGAAVTAGVFAAIGLVVAGLGNNDSGVRPRAAPAEQSAPAQKSSAPKSPAKASAAETPSAALAIHSSPRVIPNNSPAAAPQQGGPGAHTPSKNGPPGGGPPGDTPAPKPEPRGGPPPAPPGNPPVDQPVKPNPPPSNEPPGKPTDPGGTTPPPPPPPVTGGECNWPGHGGGPGGCPPGHGGVAPGQGGTPPGQGKKP